MDVYEVYHRERHPEPIPLDKGWCPFLAGKYLSSYELDTGDYHRLLAKEDEWVADSKYLEIGKDVLPPTITYHIYGQAQAVTRLRLVLFCNDAMHEVEARADFTEIAQALYGAALNQDMPETIKTELLRACSGEHESCGKLILLKVDRWQLQHTDGCEQEFIIQNKDHTSVLC